MSAPEVLVALLLGLFVLHLGFETLLRLRSEQRRLVARSDLLLTTRIGRLALRRELHHGVAGRDWAAGGDSLALRAYRGVAIVCAVDTAGAALVVAYHGERAPEPAKDSVLLIDAQGETSVRALAQVATAPGPCSVPGAAPALWRLGAAPDAAPVLARLFERGSYHVSDHALRYRQGASGRQPLTPEVLGSGSGWVAAGSALRLGLEPRDSAAGRPWTGFLAWSAPP